MELDAQRLVVLSVVGQTRHATMLTEAALMVVVMVIQAASVTNDALVGGTERNAQRLAVLTVVDQTELVAILTEAALMVVREGIQAPGVKNIALPEHMEPAVLADAILTAQAQIMRVTMSLGSVKAVDLAIMETHVCINVAPDVLDQTTPVTV
ncbi:hypothetical protein ElyMa_001240800 [Elysia marginata]|uniref:Secreted protein n=1 Tax=Elysia marginata TaxID=1093978 RepID=A0AAV4ICD3_9GAST|nr:hypothetical protein ElyMa_001240800 [Elysia marginata]